MPKITYIDAAGDARTVEVAEGISVMEGARDNDVPGIEADCGGACACATCHVFVAEEWFAKAGEPDETEAAMLEFAPEVRPTSRLSCQIKVSQLLDGLVVHTPASQH